MSRATRWGVADAAALLGFLGCLYWFWICTP